MTKREQLKELLDKAIDLNSDYGYLCHIVPTVLERLQSFENVPADLKDEYEGALREMEYIDNNLG